MDMDKEIERKFLVRTDLLPQGLQGERYVQGFLSISDNAIVRIRICEEKGEAILVVKGARDGITRPEYDSEIDIEKARKMLDLCVGGKIEKIRYKISHEGHDWTVDEFLGRNKGLWLAEIELQTEDESFAMPPWAGREVSHDERYYNANLAFNPYTNWGGVRFPVHQIS